MKDTMDDTFWRVDTKMDVALVVLFIMFWVFFVLYGVVAFCKIFLRCCKLSQDSRCHDSDDNNNFSLPPQKYYQLFP